MVDWTPVYTRAWSGTPGLTGLIDAIGTNDGVDAYVNPHTSGKGVVAQSSTYSTYVASNAVDHGLTTHTHSDTSVVNPWWSINFGEKRVKVTRVGLYGVNAAEQPRNFLVQGSNDGVSWTTLATVTGEGPTAGTWWTKEITGAVEWSRLRIYFTGNSSSGRRLIEIGEFEIWGEYLEYTGTQSTMVGLSAIRVLRTQGGEPVRIGQAAIKVLRMRQKSPFSIFTETGRTPIAVRNPST